MSTETPRTPVEQRYAGASVSDEQGIRLAADLRRAEARATAKVKDPILLREALSVIHEIVQSDLRYKPKDRTALVAYQRMKKSSAGAAGVASQRAYFEWLARNDPMAWYVLDPVVTVAPDALIFEVFSKDEGTYAQLSIARDGLEEEGEWVCGTTSIDFSQELFDGVQRIRSYRPVTLKVGPDAVAVDSGESEVIEKRIALPDSWLRGFLQVQSASTLSDASIDLDAIGLYNLLRQLRMHADEKKKGRAIRVELVPGETPSLVLEPWEELLSADGVYKGTRPEVVRIWGRRRWMLLRRLMPFVQSATLHLIGSGMPSFLVVRAGAVTLTLGLTGFTAANWSKCLQFDTMLPRTEANKLSPKVLKHLDKHKRATLDELVKATKGDATDVLQALQTACQNGLVMVDLAAGCYRLRPLLVDPPDPSKLRYRSANEKAAWDLVAAKAVNLTSENETFGVGTELVATVAVAADKREYRSQFTLTDEGRIRGAKCTCHAFRTNGLKEGPCAHLLALRLRFADLEALRAKRRESRGAVSHESRTYARRTPKGEAVTQLSLNKAKLAIRWGLRTDAKLRVQRLVFDNADDARADYYARIDGLEARGYLDASAS